MEQLTDLKAILHSKRANIYHLEMCRVLQKDGRVLYLSENKKEYQYWNIPIANTTCLLLGTGTSITQPKKTNQLGFVREHAKAENANGFLDHGNYLAYVLGVPHGFAVMHGKTRRGALVFDVADLIKDAIILPWAFVCAKEKQSEKEFRAQCLQSFVEHKALDFIFDEVKKASLYYRDEEK